ncbi:MAG: restriction endonuclease subunit S [Bacteroidales bacterium]|nr:restriction endonuclease subunit S [Bacteroidales bacterium]MDD4236844.1 restriction endonuclease subunit S [Bacteroidales bacterium]
MSEWKDCRLGEFVESISETYKFKPGEEVIFLNTSDILFGKVLNKNPENSAQLPGQAKKRIQKGDFLFSEIRPANGRYAYIDFEAQKYVVSTKLMVLRCNKNIDVNFFRLFLTSNETLDYLQMIAEDRSATFPQITFDHISSLEITLPPLATQKAIAEVLSSLDDKIDLLHRQNKTLEQMAETLFRQWFVEEAEEDWEEGFLGDVINIYDNKRIPLSKMERDKMKSGTLYPYYGAAKIMDYVNEYIFDGEYILLGEDGTVQTEEGYPVLQYATGKFWVNNHTHVITAKKPYNNFFIWNFLSKLNITNVITGAVQPKINQANLKAIGFPKYPVHKVEEFNETTSELFQKVNLNTNQLNILSNLRDTILPKLISGEIKIKAKSA